MIQQILWTRMNRPNHHRDRVTTKNHDLAPTSSDYSGCRGVSRKRRGMAALYSPLTASVICWANLSISALLWTPTETTTTTHLRRTSQSWRSAYDDPCYTLLWSSMI